MLDAAVGREFQSHVVSKQTRFFKNTWFCVYLGFGYLGPSITCGSKNVRQQTEWWDILLLAWLLKHCLVYVSKICDHCTLHMLIFLAEFRYQNHLAKEAALINLSPTRGNSSSAKYPSGPCPVCRTGPHSCRADALWRRHWSLGVPRHHLHVSCFHCGHVLSRNHWAPMWAHSCSALKRTHHHHESKLHLMEGCHSNPGAKQMVPKRIRSQGGHRATSGEFSGQSSGVGRALTAKVMLYMNASLPTVKLIFL